MIYPTGLVSSMGNIFRQFQTKMTMMPFAGIPCYDDKITFSLRVYALRKHNKNMQLYFNIDAGVEGITLDRKYTAWYL